MTLWDDLPSSLTSGGALEPLRPLLDSVGTPTSTERSEADGTWRIWSQDVGDGTPLAVDLASGRTSRSPSGAAGLGGAGGALEVDGAAQLELGLRLTAPGGDPDGTVRLVVATPRARLTVPGLRGAQLDPQGQLRADPAHPAVRFHLPSLRIRLLLPAGGTLAVDLLSATTGTGAGTDNMYELIRMEPGHALLGPGDVVGFAFRGAVLDLSATSGPTGVPAHARRLPDAWQGLYLPEVRLFVAPQGMEGLAVSAGVRNLWIGVGVHEGITGELNAEVVNRGAAPQVRVRALTPTGEWIGVPDSPADTAVELPEQVTLLVDAGGGLAPYTITLTVDGTTTTSDRVEVSVPATGDRTVVVQVSDPTGRSTTRTLTLRRRTTGAGAGGSGGTDVTATTTSSVGHAVRVLTRTATHARVTLQPEASGSVTWTWPGGSATGTTAEVPVAAGSPVTVTATVTRTTGTVTTISGYMAFAHPTEAQLGAGASSGPGSATSWPLAPANIRETAWRTRTDPGPALPWLDPAGRARLAALPRSARWTVAGFASYEQSTETRDPGHAARNQALSARRRDAFVALLRDQGFTDVAAGAAHGDTQARTSTAPESPEWWRATATADVTQTVLVTATLDRAILPPTRDLDPAPSRAPVPACFRKVGVTVELVRDTFVRLEIYGEVDIDTVAEQRLRANGATDLPSRNPNDGLSRFLVRLRIAEDRTSWDVTAQFTALDADRDGLWQRRQQSLTSPSAALNVLGAVAAMGPLLAATTPPSPTAGELVPMAVVGGVAVALGAANVLTTHVVTLHGAQLVITSGLVDPATGTGPRAHTVSVLLDVETAFSFDVGVLRIDPQRPVTTRYRALGVRAAWRDDPQPDGTVQYVPLPVFDPSQGYTLDIPAGAIGGPPGLEELLRILGARISQDNPRYLDVEVALGVDLGIVTVDSARVRIRIDGAADVQLTGLGASITVPGTLHGRGSVEIDETGFAGSFDLTLTPLNLRVSATLAVRSTPDGVTGVLVGAEVQFPVPLMLGQSGLAIYGFLGGVGVNFARKEDPGARTPALAWLEQQLKPPRNSVMHHHGWELRPGSYAVAGGVLLGTAEGGFMVHLKGIVLIEVPGPRLLFAMKADVLKLPPVLKDGDQQASFLAVLDLDFGRGTITIGVVAAYEIHQLLSIRVPVTAFFDTKNLDQWYVELGSPQEPVTVNVLDVIEGVGYLVVHGDGRNVSIPKLPVITQGLTVATGFHLRAVLMGSRAVGLFLEVAAGFDAVVSFQPFAIGGRIYVSGELRLFIIGISASAELTVIVGPQRVDVGTATERVEDRTYVYGKVCGKVDFFFFSVEGCVSLEIGTKNPAPLTPPPLVAGVSLVSRSPALLEGSAVDRAVDGLLGTAVAVGETGTPPSVPLDAVPVVMFRTAPAVAPGDVVLGGTARGGSALPSDPWVRRGDQWWRYRVTSVELAGTLRPGRTPATWWSRKPPADPEHGPALALLSWLPTPHPRAVELGEQLRTTVTERWGTICTPAAPATPVLWTFDGAPPGPSPVGWDLTGVAWPDPDGTFRTSPADLRARVREPWRTGDHLADLLQGTDPAVVVGDRVTCSRDQGRWTAAGTTTTGTTTHVRTHVGTHANDVHGTTGFVAGFSTLPTAGAGTQAVLDLLADGGGIGLHDVGALWAWTSGDKPESAWESGPNCQGRLLRGPHGDTGSPAERTDEYETHLVRRAWEKQHFEPSELADSVRLRVEAGLTRLDVLLLVRRADLPVLHLRDRDGHVIGTRPVDGSDLLGGSLPSRWTDPAGPWYDPVVRAAQLAGRVVAAEPGLVPALVGLDVPDDTVEVEIGWERHGKPSPRPFWVVAFTATTAAEVHREDWDTRTVVDDKDALTSAVELDPDDHALFVPGQEYTVRVRWEAEHVTQEARPAVTPWPTSGLASSTQEFRFRADGAAAAPAHLDPWVLTTSPAPEETGVLTGEPLQLALSNQKVAELFDAYGYELQVTVRSASGRHPEPPTGGGPGDAVVVPVVAALELLLADGTPNVHQPTAAVQVMTPWQEAVTELLNRLPCVSGEGSRTHHSVVTLRYGLEPLTDYLLDVEAVPKAGVTAPRRRVYRVPFTTSRFGSAADLARLTHLAPVRHRVVPTPTALTSTATLPDVPTGDRLDAAFQAAGLPTPQVPRYPSVEVLWSADAVPQPVAVVVESSEPMWRSRPAPTKVSGPVDAADPTHQWWAARPADWLGLVEATAPPGPDDPPRAGVSRVVQGPGGTRAVVVLAAGSRGRELRLDLLRSADALAGAPEQRSTAVQVLLGAAPWEVED